MRINIQMTQVLPCETNINTKLQIQGGTHISITPFRDKGIRKGRFSIGSFIRSRTNAANSNISVNEYSHIESSATASKSKPVNNNPMIASEFAAIARYGVP
mmetsp:Transcript_9613/g.10950  ORF Transcript_9613/g.10950 Transcript_9613/m.10950 type:complete len:101 (-) Transcript_9613:393-695(-)